MMPPLQAVIGKPVRARAGVRATPPRSDLGTLPLAGRAHTCGRQPRNVWTLGGMGSRGLLYHAIAAAWVVEAAVHEDPSHVPDALRDRCEFGALLCSKLRKLAQHTTCDSVRAD
jgi:hypothetical protein